MPTISCLLVSHNKPQFVAEAIGTILLQDQYTTDWEAVVMDSGVLYDQGFFDKYDDCRINVYKTNETEELRARVAMAPYSINEMFRRGLVNGDLCHHLFDDDTLLPHAFATFIDYFRAHPRAMAVYASQDVGIAAEPGKTQIIGERLASGVGGKCCAGRVMDCQVDGSQLCYRKIVLNSFPTNEFWPESKVHGSHADGLFMEKIGLHYPIHPINVKIGCNRRTPLSLYGPLSV